MPEGHGGGHGGCRARRSRSGTPTAASRPGAWRVGEPSADALVGKACARGRLPVRLALVCFSTVCSLTGRQPSGRLAFLGWWLLPAHCRRPAPTPGSVCGARPRALGGETGGGRGPLGGRGQRQQGPEKCPLPGIPLGPGGGMKVFLSFSLQLRKEHVRAFLVAPC